MTPKQDKRMYKNKRWNIENSDLIVNLIILPKKFTTKTGCLLCVTVAQITRFYSLLDQRHCGKSTLLCNRNIAVLYKAL